jgi:hypothetical protein
VKSAVAIPILLLLAEFVIACTRTPPVSSGSSGSGEPSNARLGVEPGGSRAGQSDPLRALPNETVTFLPKARLLTNFVWNRDAPHAFARTIDGYEVIDARTGSVIRNVESPHAQGLRDAVYLRDPERLVTVSYGQRGLHEDLLESIDTKTGQSVAEQRAQVLSAHFSPDGALVAWHAADGRGGGDSTEVIVADTATLSTRINVAVEHLVNDGIQFSPTGRWLYVSQDSKATVVDARTGQPREWPILGGAPPDLSPDGRFAVWDAPKRGNLNRVVVWDGERERELVSPDTTCDRRKFRAVFDAAGRRLALGGRDGVCLFDVETLEPLPAPAAGATGPSPDAWTQPLLFQDDDRALATRRYDGHHEFLELHRLSDRRRVFATAADGTQTVTTAKGVVILRPSKEKVTLSRQSLAGPLSIRVPGCPTRPPPDDPNDPNDEDGVFRDPRLESVGGDVALVRCPGPPERSILCNLATGAVGPAPGGGVLSSDGAVLFSSDRLYDTRTGSPLLPPAPAMIFVKSWSPPELTLGGRSPAGSTYVQRVAATESGITVRAAAEGITTCEGQKAEEGGPFLVVLSKQGAAVCSRETGALLRRLPVPPDAALWPLSTDGPLLAFFHGSETHVYDVRSGRHTALASPAMNLYASGKSLLLEGARNDFSFLRSFTDPAAQTWEIREDRPVQALAFDGAVVLLATPDGLEARKADTGEFVSRAPSVHDHLYPHYLAGDVVAVPLVERIDFYRLPRLELLGHAMTLGEGRWLFASARGAVELSGPLEDWSRDYECRIGTRTLPFEACAERYGARGVAVELIGAKLGASGTR